MESDRQQPDGHATCVIAQHYSSATFVSMHFTSRDEQSGARFKYFIISHFKLEKLNKFEIS